MSETDVQADEVTDPELISRVRAGDVASYGTLFSRHVDAATRLAWVLIGGSDADDLVSEAFVKVLNVLLGGGGPDIAFRAYLLTAVRRLHIDKVRSNQRLTTTDDLSPFDPGVPFTDTAVAGFEGGAAAKAFASLPERWQMVLWHLEVENQKPAEIAPLLGMSANSVSALAYRAREGLRQAFLTMHAGDLVGDDCKDTNDLLGGYVRAALSRRDARRVDDHLEHCRRCTAVYLELTEVNSSLSGILGPIVLGGAAATYLGGGAATPIGASLVALLGRSKEAVFAHVSATAATTAVAGLAAITAIAVISRGPEDAAPTAEGPSSLRMDTSSATDPAGSQRAEPDWNPDWTPGWTPDWTPGWRLGSTQPSAAAGPAGATSPDLGLDGDSAATSEAGGASTSGTGSSSSSSTGSSSGGGGSGTSQLPDQGGQSGAGNGGSSGTGDTTTVPTGRGSPHRRNPADVPGPPQKPPRTPPPTTQPTQPTPPQSTPPQPTPPQPTPPQPTPPQPTPPQPTPSQPSTPTVDVGVRISRVLNREGHMIVRAQVTGIPSGAQVRLTATASAGDLRAHGGSCRRSGNGYSCTATRSSSTFQFDWRGSSDATLAFTISAPDGYEDSSSGNNRVTVQASGDDDDDHHHGHGPGHG